MPIIMAASHCGKSPIHIVLSCMHRNLAWIDLKQAAVSMARTKPQHVAELRLHIDPSDEYPDLRLYLTKTANRKLSSIPPLKVATISSRNFIPSEDNPYTKRGIMEHTPSHPLMQCLLSVIHGVDPSWLRVNLMIALARYAFATLRTSMLSLIILTLLHSLSAVALPASSWSQYTSGLIAALTAANTDSPPRRHQRC